jgi:hypothetical protein
MALRIVWGSAVVLRPGEERRPDVETVCIYEHMPLDCEVSDYLQPLEPLDERLPALRQGFHAPQLLLSSAAAERFPGLPSKGKWRIKI